MFLFGKGCIGLSVLFWMVTCVLMGQTQQAENQRRTRFQKDSQMGKNATPNAWSLGTDCRWGAAGYTWSGDFNGDGVDDIASGYGASVLMHLSQGNSFENEVWPVAPYWNAAHWTWAGDFDGDGRSDICSVAGGNAYLKLSQGNSFVNDVWQLSASWGSHLYTWVADFNGDGKADIASANGGSVYMKLSTGSGFESETWTLPNQWGHPNYTRIGDFNGDGRADIASGFGATVLIHLSQGNHFENNVWTGPPVWGDPAYTWVADFNGDGLDDLATAIGSKIYLLNSAGDFFYTSLHHISGKWFTAGYTFKGDFNGDGRADIATASDRRVHYYLSGNQGFSEGFWPVSASWGVSQYVRVGDFNGDGADDIASPSGCYVYMKPGKKEPIDINQPADVYAAIEAFTPTVYFHPDEEYFTDSVENFLATADLYAGEVFNDNDYDSFAVPYRTYISTNWNDYGLANGIDLLREIIAPQGIAEVNLRFWLAETAFTNRQGSVSATKVYVSAKADVPNNKLNLQYWYFYPYNGPGRYEACVASPSCYTHQLLDVGRHEGDWENVNVGLYLDSGLISEVTLSGHGDDKESTLYLQWEDETHPIVHSAKYSHAFYPSAGKHDYMRVFEYDYRLGTASIDLYDQAGFGLVQRVENSSGYEIAASNISSLGLTPPEWASYTWRWGSYEKLAYTIDFSFYGIDRVIPFKEVGWGPTRVWNP